MQSHRLCPSQFLQVSPSVHENSVVKTDLERTTLVVLGVGTVLAYGTAASAWPSKAKVDFGPDGPDGSWVLQIVCGMMGNADLWQLHDAVAGSAMYAPPSHEASAFILN